MICARGSRSASASDSGVLPVAVAPQMTISGGAGSSADERSDKCVWPGALDAHVDQSTEECFLAVEVDELVLAVAAGDAWSVARAVAVRRWGAQLIDQDLGRAAHPAGVGLGADLLLQVEQRLQAALLLGSRHVV